MLKASMGKASMTGSSLPDLMMVLESEAGQRAKDPRKDEKSLYRSFYLRKEGFFIWRELLFSSRLLKLDTTLVREEDGELGQHK